MVLQLQFTSKTSSSLLLLQSLSESLSDTRMFFSTIRRRCCALSVLSVVEAVAVVVAEVRARDPLGVFFIGLALGSRRADGDFVDNDGSRTSALSPRFGVAARAGLLWDASGTGSLFAGGA